MLTDRISRLCCLIFLLPASTILAAEVSIKQTNELKEAIAISPDFSKFVERTKMGDGFANYGVKITEVNSGSEGKNLDWDKDWGNPYGASFSPDGKKLAIMCGGLDRETIAKVFDITSGDMELNVRHSGLKFVAFTSDSKCLASAGGPGASSPKETLWIWDIETRKKTVTDSPTTPTCLAFSADGKFVAAAHGLYINNPPLLTLCKVMTGARMATFKRDEKEDALAVAVSPDSKLVAAGTKDGTIKLFDVAYGKEVLSFNDIQDEILSVAFDPKENLIAAIGKDKTIRFWDLGSKKLISTTKLPKLDKYMRLQFSTDGTQLATATTIMINIWSVKVDK